MGNRPGYKTAHELANELLSMPDVIVALAASVFDMPGMSHAMPVRAKLQDVQGTDVVLLVVDTDAHEREHDAGPAAAAVGA